MALFTINRFHGEEDEEEASEERAQALLQRLHEKAKARQLEKQRASDAGKGTPVPKREDSVDNSSSPSKSETRTTTQTPRSGKKKSKGTGEGEVPKPENESALPTESQTLKASKEEKRKKKKMNSEQEEMADVMKTRDSEHEEEHELGKKVTVKTKRRKSESESRNEEESMTGEKRKRKSTSELINDDGPGDKKGDKSKTSKKSELGDKVGKEGKEKGKEKGKQKKRNSATELEKEDELGKDVGEQSDEEQSNEDEENRSEVLEGEEETTPKTDLETSSLVLGGFQKKAVEKVQRVLPFWLSHPSRVQKDIKQHLVPIHEVPGIHPKLLKKLQANNIHSFFPVQAEVIPAILESAHHGFLIGRGGYRPSDICVSAPTGSGKTLAFVLPVIQALLDRVVCHVRALVVLPTKELAQQVCKVFSIYANGTHLKIVAVTGQKSFVREQETLVEKSFMGFRSMADIVVATPGRLVDHIEQTPGFSLKELRFLIIDEADRMIDSLSQDWLNRVTKAVYRHEDGDDPNSIFARKEPGPITAASTWFPQMPLQKLLFSATLTKNPEKLQQLGLYLPRLFTSVFDKSAGSADTEEDSERSYTLPQGLTHYYVPCNLNSKPLILLHFLITLKFTRVLCFTNSREASHRLFLLVQAFGGVRTAEFSSRLSASERQKTLKQFEQGKIQILISTDATARGIDIQGVTCVINYDAPQFMRVYIHRVGRTARAGKSGLAFTLLLNVQKHQFLRMVKDSGTSELQKQFVKSENLKPLLERYEEALVELQRTVADERVKRRA